MKPEVTKTSFLCMQVCVPKHWDDEQIVNFAEQENPCGTESGWLIRRQGSEYLGGDDERVPCCERDGFVHIMLDA